MYNEPIPDLEIRIDKEPDNTYIWTVLEYGLVIGIGLALTNADANQQIEAFLRPN